MIDRRAGRDDNVQQVRVITGDEWTYAFDAVNIGDMQDLGLAARSNSNKGL